MLELLAQTAPSTQGSPLVQQIVSFLPIGLVLLLLYFFVFNTKRKDEKSRKAMIDAIKKGDKVQTIGGILGTVLTAEADEIVIKIDESTNTKIRFVRSAVAKVVTAEAAKTDAK